MGGKLYVLYGHNVQSARPSDMATVETVLDICTYNIVCTAIGVAVPGFGANIDVYADIVMLMQLSPC